MNFTKSRLRPPVGPLTFLLLAASFQLIAQDDSTTRNGPSGLSGGWITGPASNPLSFLNGPAYRTFGSATPYDFRDLRPVSHLDEILPAWLSFGAEERFRFEGYRNGNFKLGNDDSYFLNRFRFQVNLQLKPWLRVTSQVQDSRPFAERGPLGPPNQNNWDLKLAYLEIGNPEKYGVSLRVGRQLINFNNTLLANSEWRNQGRSYDAVAANLHHGRYRLGIIAASVVIPLASGISHHRGGNNIYGLYGAIDNPIRNSTLEPFVLWRVQPAVPVESDGRARTGKQSMHAYGLRFKEKATGSLDYSAEAVVERGSDGPNDIRAWGATAGLAYQTPFARIRPRVFVQYDYASGDNAPSDGVHRTFDTIYPTAHDRFGILDLFGWQNIQAIRAGVTIIPRRRWSVTTQFLDFWLACAADGVYNSSGSSIARDLNGRPGTHIGREADIYTWHEINQHMNVGVGFGRLRAGEFLLNTTSSRDYSGYYVAINFKDAGRSEVR